MEVRFIMSRPYREKHKEHGQTAPLELSDYVIKLIEEMKNKPMSILDVGCGSGEQFKKISYTVGKETFSRTVALDWSTKAVDLLKTKDVYNEVYLAQSSKLPFKDQEFDVVLSIENLEHLYKEDVIPAIEEMKRVAKYIILVTPLPSHVINHHFLNGEISEAKSDKEYLNYEEFIVLEGTIHKSVVYPNSMNDAGFQTEAKSHGYYFGQSNNIDTNMIKFVGIPKTETPTDIDLRDYYLKLLENSKNLKV
jgi:SAM-dependent methyltransferase